MSIICGDLHGNLIKAKKALAYKQNDEHVFLGDYLDSFNIGPSQQVECLRLLLDSNAILLIGNHELHYLKNPPFKCSGYQYDPMFLTLYEHLINGNKKRFKAAYVCDNYICTHAGIHDKLAKHDDIDKQAKYLNGQLTRFLNNANTKTDIFNISRSRGGCNNFGGIFWLDTTRDSGLSNKYNQISGHTEVKTPQRDFFHDRTQWLTNEWINLDVTNSPECYVFDTKTKEIILL